MGSDFDGIGGKAALVALAGPFLSGCGLVEFDPLRLSPEWPLFLGLNSVAVYASWAIGTMVGTTVLDVVRARASDRMADQAIGGVATAQEGELVRIEGVVAPAAELVVAPVSERRVVGYRASARCWRKVKFERGWYQEVDVSRAATFDVVAGSDRVRVRGPVCCVDKGPMVQEGPASTRRLRWLLWSRLCWHRRFWGPLHRYRFRELLIEPGDRVQVVGRLGSKAPGEQDGYRQAPGDTTEVLGSWFCPVAVMKRDASHE